MKVQLIVTFVVLTLGLPALGQQAPSYQHKDEGQSTTAPAAESESRATSGIKEDNPRNKPDDRSGPNWSNWALVFVGIGAIVVGLMTLNAIKKQGDNLAVQTSVLQESVSVSRMAVSAAKTNADALINSERAWIAAELVPTAAKYGGQWHRIESYGAVLMSQQEILDGHHLRHRLKFTNIGRTPAHILGFQIGYYPLLDDDTDWPQEKHLDDCELDFWLTAGTPKEIYDPIVDIEQHVIATITKIGDAKTTGLHIRGWVKYQHVFSVDHNLENADFWYVYTASTGQLTKAPSLKAKQKNNNPN